VSPIEVLARKADFQRIHSEGRALRGPDVVVVYIRTDRPACRCAVVASRKVGSAVRRNRAKRVLREAQRVLFCGTGLAGIDILLIARTGAGAQTSRALREQVASLLLREGVLSGTLPVRPGEIRDSS
jgi:ribonuclease P protein component